MSDAIQLQMVSQSVPSNFVSSMHRPTDWGKGEPDIMTYLEDVECLSTVVSQLSLFSVDRVSTTHYGEYRLGRILRRVQLHNCETVSGKYLENWKARTAPESGAIRSSKRRAHAQEWR